MRGRGSLLQRGKYEKKRLIREGHLLRRGSLLEKESLLEGRVSKPNYRGTY